MEVNEFDATLGGNEHLPYSANSLRFAASRSIEIAAMSESILRPSMTKLIFQTLPVHMRRRVMSHNCKRLPRKLREGHLEQLKKSGLPPKQKRPSRKYRRRPGNLLEEYNRRQRRNVWLETHIWHAKRFHMIERWGYRLANAPCDKAFRACYRATSAHCLMQDISYMTPILLTAPTETLRNLFSKITSTSCGLSVTAKAYITGNREGTVHLYTPNEYPLNYIGKVSYIWEPEDAAKKYRNLCLFVHPSQTKQVETILSALLCSDIESFEIPEKRRKLSKNSSENIQVKVLAGSFNRFRLTGPNSHAILSKALKCVRNIDNIKTNKWVNSCNANEIFKLKLEENQKYWQTLGLAGSPSQLPPRIIIGLVVKDPRLSRPSKRSKALSENSENINTDNLINIPASASFSPLWNTDIHDVIKEKILTNGQYIAHITKTQLVPGEVFEDDPVLQSVPVVLVQRPGSQDTKFKKLGFGSGWDIIVPSGYALQFWQTFIMFGARSGGLRETESLAFEMGECYFPPDSEAGKTEEHRVETEMREKYFRLPPSKRVNYIKLGINSPFVCQWKVLLKDWGNHQDNQFYVLRDKQLLTQIQDCLDNRAKLPQIHKAASCLVPIYLQMVKKGHLKRHALICSPQDGDKLSINILAEHQKVDLNEGARKKLRMEHKKEIKQLRRKKIKLKKKQVQSTNTKSAKQSKREPSEYVKKMRELWLPSNIENVRHVCSREVIGYLSQAAFSFSEAKSCGTGYIPYNALVELLKNYQNFVLVRNTTSLKYRPANIQIIKS